MKQGWAACALAFAAGAAFAQQQGPGFDIDFDVVRITTEHVAGQVHMLRGDGGNIGVFVGEDGVFLVDDQFAPLTERIRAAIAEISGEPVRFVINTHFHDDHTNGNENFAEIGALIVAHENVRITLSRPHFIETVETIFPAFPEQALPVITFRDRVRFHLNGEDVEVFHVPAAHTDGDSIVYFRGSNVVHMGDVLRLRGPIFDQNNGGSYLGLIRALDTVLGVVDENTRIIPGHGGLATRDQLREVRDGLTAVRDRIAAAIAEGKNVEQTIAEDPTRGYQWSMPRLMTMDKIIEWIYREIESN
jgi:glyoxylase-like metal-dependent hydrolase (beta-lactamase superfamily II)